MRAGLKRLIDRSSGHLSGLPLSEDELTHLDRIGDRATQLS
jgi:hypothetical protein